MSGKIEAIVEGFLNRMLLKQTFLPELHDANERKIGGGHFTLMAFYSSFALVLGYMAGHPRYGALASLGTFLLIAEAERPPIGRRVDWYTRGAGWMIGAVCSLVTLFTK